jgi:SAM-dependent methyltransferase
MVTQPGIERVSWRDPDGFVLRVNDRLLRGVTIEKAEQTRELLREPWMVRLIGERTIPVTVEISDAPLVEAADKWLWLEHEPLPFPIYPHEITALQLFDSGELTLKIAIEAAQHGWILKDASAWNVLYSAGRPSFVDILSFERLKSRTWIAYGQFVRHFLLPLLLHRKLGMSPADVFLTNRDGIAPERAYQLLRGSGVFSPTSLELILLPKWLSRPGSRMVATAAKQGTLEPRAFDPAISGALVLSTLRRLQRMLERLRPDPSRARSVWKSYEEERTHYTEADLIAKKQFVGKCLEGGGSVLDLGCNAGEFSLLAAETCETVAASDFDHAALSRLYERIRGKAGAVTPVILDVARPTPAVGWQNKEIPSFLERAVGQFSCILVLGLIHHLLVTERAGLPMLVDLFERLNPKAVILEWIEPADPKFRQLAGLNHALYDYLNMDRLEECFGQKFRLLEKFPLPCTTRVMYLWGR